MSSTSSSCVTPFSIARGKWKVICSVFPIATRAAQVIRLRSRLESWGRSQTSPNSTLSLSSTSFGAKLPMAFCAAVAGCLTSLVVPPCVCTSPLFAKSYESVRQLRAGAASVSKLSHEEPQRLCIAGDPPGACIHPFEADVADERCGHLLSARLVAAVHQAGPRRAAARLEDVEQHLARHGVEGADDLRASRFLRQFLRARRREADDEAGVAVVHREGAGDDDHAGQVAGLAQHIVHSRPVHAEQDRVRVPCCLAGRACARVCAGLACEGAQLLLAPRIAEDDFMPGPRENRSELSAHQSRTQNADSHATLLASATGPFLEVLRITSSLHRDLRGGALDLAEVVRRQCDVGCSEILLQAVQLRGSRNGHDPRLLRQHPGESDLSRGRVLPRSEEHTSELQSRLHLVCRLLLEKKKSEKLTTYRRYRSGQPRSATPNSFIIDCSVCCTGWLGL